MRRAHEEAEAELRRKQELEMQRRRQEEAERRRQMEMEEMERRRTQEMEEMMREEEDRARRDAEDEDRRRQEAERRRERAEAGKRQKEEGKKGAGGEQNPKSARKGEGDLNFKGGDPLDHNDGDIDLEPFLKPLLSQAGGNVEKLGLEALRRALTEGTLLVVGVKLWSSLHSETWRHREAAA